MQKCPSIPLLSNQLGLKVAGAVALLGFVQFLKSMMVILLALVWSVASHHCKLEHLPGLEFLACQEHGNTSGHADADCEKDGCAAFENQLYRSEEAPVAWIPPVPLVEVPAVTVPAASPSTGGVTPPPPDAEPRLLSGRWQFSSRAALPPRAPSAHS